jgi:hypothetical protein
MLTISLSRLVVVADTSAVAIRATERAYATLTCIYAAFACTSLRRKQEVECEWSELTAQLHMEDKLKRSLQAVQTVANTAKRAVSETEEQIADVRIFVFITLTTA